MLGAASKAVELDANELYRAVVVFEVDNSVPLCWRALVVTGLVKVWERGTPRLLRHDLNHKAYLSSQCRSTCMSVVC